MMAAVVYLTLAALFSSFWLPLAVLVPAPLAAAAGLAALWATGAALTVFAQIGLLLSIGLLAKNAILVIDFAEGARADGADAAEAARQAGEARFRPVVMTSIATLLGALPLALATGPGAEGRAVIGTVAMAGVLGATLIALFLTPALYRIAASRLPPRGEAGRLLDAELSDSPARA
jgi:multidrug efflux pump